MSRKKRRKNKQKPENTNKPINPHFNPWSWSERDKTDKPLTPHNFYSQARFLSHKGMNFPHVFITQEVHDRMSLYIELCPQEITWFGTVKVLPSGDFLIERLFLPKQEVSGSHARATTDGMTEMGMDILNEPDGCDTYDRLRFWGHSHVHMGTFASGTDDNEAMTSIEAHPFYIRAICNKYGRAEFTLYLKKENLIVNDAPWSILEDAESADGPDVESPEEEDDDAEYVQLRKEIEAEIEAKVTQFRATIIRPAEIEAPSPAQGWRTPFDLSNLGFASLWGWPTKKSRDEKAKPEETKPEAAENSEPTKDKGQGETQ